MLDKASLTLSLLGQSSICLIRGTFLILCNPTPLKSTGASCMDIMINKVINIAKTHRKDTLLENGPKVQTKGTGCCCSRYWCHQYRLQQQLVLLVWTGRKGGNLVPGHGTTRCQYWSIGTEWRLQLVPNDHGVKGTGSWHHPVPIVQVKAPGDATIRCQPLLCH